jgi:hypothetical protein
MNKQVLLNKASGRKMAVKYVLIPAITYAHALLSMQSPTQYGL